MKLAIHTSETLHFGLHARHHFGPRIPTFCAALSLLLVIPLVFGNLATTTQGAPPTQSVFFGETLRRAKITMTVEDQTLEQVLSQLLGSVNLGVSGKTAKEARETIRSWSLWLDRRIDPDQPITLTAAGTPASRIILDVVQSVGLVAYPLPGVLLVGRPEWVQGVLANLPWQPDVEVGTKRAQDRITIRWPTGTPAASVLGLLLTAPKTQMTELNPSLTFNQSLGWLPHDVWRAGRLVSVERSLAAALVLAQFDRRLANANVMDSLVSSAKSDSQPSPIAARKVPLPNGVHRWDGKAVSQEFLQSYPSGEAALTIRKSLKGRKPRVTIRTFADRLTARTTAANHLEVIAKLWAMPIPNQANANAGKPEAVFDLKLVNKPVADVLKQLAGAAGKKIRFAPGTELASERLVSLDAVKQSLKQLAIEVAGQVDLQVDWNEAEVVILKPPGSLETNPSSPAASGG